MTICFHAKCWFLAAAAGMIPGGTVIAEDARSATTSSDAEPPAIVGVYNYGFSVPKEADESGAHDSEYLRKRIAGYADFDAAAADLTDPAGGYESAKYAHMMFTSGGSIISPSVEFAQVLADRRTARLYTFLKEMPAGEASRRVEKLFDAMLEHHQTVMSEKELDFREIARTGDPKVVSAHAVRVALFLCGVFSKPSTVLQKLDQWEPTFVPTDDEIANLDVFKEQPVLDDLVPEVKQISSELVSASEGPRRLFVLNMYGFVLQQNGGIPSTEVSLGSSVTVPAFQDPAMWFSHYGRLLPWDAPQRPRFRSRIEANTALDADAQNPDVLLQTFFAVYEDGSKGMLAKLRKCVEAL